MSTDTIPADVPALATPDESSTVTSRAERIWQRVDGWLDHASDYLNPILVKETRQALRSRQFVLWFLLLLAACWVVTVGVVAWMGPGVEYQAAGGTMFIWYYGLLAFALVVVVPFAAFRSLASEQEDNTRDVLMVSALTPHQVINGKLGSAGLQIMIYLSALSPCLAFTYLLRGIDLLTIFLVPAFAVVVSLSMSMLALLGASASRQRFTQVFSSVGLLAILLAVFAFTMTVGVQMVQAGYFGGFWAVAGGFLNLLLCANLLAYYAAVGMNAFASANRSTSLRRVMLFSQACFVGWAAAIWRETNYDDEVWVALATLAGIYWYGMGTLLTGEQAVLSERVRRTLPTTHLGRMFGTWFNPGPGTGYLFVVANLTSLAAFWAAAAVFRPRWNATDELCCLLVGYAYVLGYLGFGRILISLLRRFAPLSMLGCFLIQFLLLLAGVGVPELLRNSFVRSARLTWGWFDLTNPLRTLNRMYENDLSVVENVTVLTVVPGVAFCVFLVNMILAAREIQQTRAPLPTRVIEDDLELNPIEEQVVNPWGDVRPAE